MKQTHKISKAVFVALIVLVVMAINGQALAQGTWTTKAPMPTARYGPGAGVINGMLYVVGGANVLNACSYSGVLEVYDPATDTWVTKAPMPTTRESLGVGVVNGILYAVGGATGCGAYTSTLEAYDPVTNTWMTKAPMSTPRYPLSVGVVNGILYAVSGGNSSGLLATVEAYDPATNVWTPRAPIPTPRHSFGLGVVNGIIYAVGGGTTAGMTGSVEAYDPATDTWTTKASMPTPRLSLAVGVVNGILYAVGGSCISGDCATVEAYDPATDTWTTVTSMPTARLALAIGVVNDILYAVGGFANISPYLQATNEAFTPVIEAAALVIDEDSIDNGNPPNFFSAINVNDQSADIGQRAQLPFFAANVGATITLHTGQVGDEGWFALKTIPAEWTAAGPTADGLTNYLAAGPGLGTADANGDREALLDKVPDVTPLRATGLKLLEGKQVCAVVYDSDISINYGPLNGSLKGANLGTVAFKVLSVSALPGFSSSSLPQVEVEILDAETVCAGQLTLFTEAPEPTSSSEPFDVVP